MSGKMKRIKVWFQKLSKGKKIAVITGALCVCLAITGGLILLSKLNSIDTEEIDADDIVINDSVLPTEGYTNVALFGIDSRSGELEIGTRTDCLIIASLNNATKEVRMVSVYRDTVLDIEENRLQKCNAAYAFGGPTQAINMLNKNLDLNIQDYVTVDFAAIANTIDLLGGLDIEIKEEEVKPLNKFVKETARVAGKEANTISGSGLQHLDGVQATTYARIRSTAGGDFTRTERQRLVIEKIVEKAQHSDIGTINKIIDELFPTIKTSFSVTEILAYAKDFMKYDIAASGGFPFEKTTATISGLGSIVIPVNLTDNVSELHKFFYDVDSYMPSDTVNAISDAIVARVGQRQATDYDTLSSKTYVDTEEDKAQEHEKYPQKEDTTTVPEEQKDQNSKDDTINEEKPSKDTKPKEEGSSDKDSSSKPDTDVNVPPETTPETTPEVTPDPPAEEVTPPDAGGADSEGSSENTGNDNSSKDDAGEASESVEE